MPLFLTENQIATMPIKPTEWRKIKIAIPVGQIEDRVYSLTDGKRLHYQLFPDGRECIHVDQFDPDRNPLYAVLHIANETPVGKLVKFALFALTIAAFVKSESKQ